MFNTVVAATDGSAHARKAVELASDIAGKYGAKLILCHVLMHGPLSADLRRMLEVEHLLEPARARPVAVGGGVPNAAGMFRADEPDAGYLRDAVEALGKMVMANASRAAHDHGAEKVETSLRDGDAAEQILECAKQGGADLIVVGSRGLGDLEGLLMGSVSHKVSQLADCTCVTVK